METNPSIPDQTDNPAPATVPIPEEPPVGTRVRDRDGDTWTRTDKSLISGKPWFLTNTHLPELADDSAYSDGLSWAELHDGFAPITLQEPAPPMAWRVAADLRTLAAVLDQHPDLKCGGIIVSFSLHQPEDVEDWAAALDVKALDTSDTLPARDARKVLPSQLMVRAYAYLPKPDPAEVAKALAFYRKYGPADRAVARCAGCRAMITSTPSQPWTDQAGSSQCASSGDPHQPEGHGPRAGERP